MKLTDIALLYSLSFDCDNVINIYDINENEDDVIDSYYELLLYARKYNNPEVISIRPSSATGIDVEVLI